MRATLIPYSPALKERARYLRQHMTLGEVLLWKEIKGRKLCGADFDRQRPLGEFIVDFYCKELSLAIEIDGASHDFNQDRDDRRQRTLEDMGVTVLRFWDHQVRTDMRVVLERIGTWIREHREHVTGNPPRPSGTPPKEGT